MNNPEDKLRAPTLAAPGLAHRARMDALFHAKQRGVLPRKPMPVWQCAFACTFCAAMLVLALLLLNAPPCDDSRQAQGVFCIIELPASAASISGAGTEGFLTDPRSIHVKAYSITSETTVEPVKKT